MTGQAMDLTWGPEFDAVAEAARQMCTATDVADALSRPGSRPELWRQLTAMGWVGATDPLGADTDAATLGSLAGVFVELGRSLAATPLLSAITARELLLLSQDHGSTELCSAMSAGSRLVIPVLADPAFDAGVGPLVLVDDVLQGISMFVPFAQDATDLVVEVGGGPDRRLVLVPTGAPGLTIEHLPNLSDHPTCAVTFDTVDTAGLPVLARGDEVSRIAGLVVQRAAVLEAAEVYGAGCELLKRTVEYAKTREQFGGPIGRFQAVQYLCTDIAIDVHLVSVFARRAADLLDRHEPAEHEVAMMRAHAAKTAEAMVHCAHEVHAAIGYMLESELHLYTRAAKRWQFALGSPWRHAQTVVSGL